MSLCGTLDLKRNYLEFGTLFNNNESFYIGQAEQWFTARLNDFQMSPPAPDPAAGTYDFYVRDAVSLMAIYLCADGYLRRQTEIEADNWWEPYRTRAEDTLEKLRTGEYRLSYQTSLWEHGLSPAIPTTNGTISAAPAANICTSNHGLTGATFTGLSAMTALIELDGTGTLTSTQSFRWRWDETAAAWEQTGVTLDTPYWHALGYGLKVYFRTPELGTLCTGMQWKVRCNPLGETIPSKGITSGMRSYG
jgi:hypothetical protein